MEQQTWLIRCQVVPLTIKDYVIKQGLFHGSLSHMSLIPAMHWTCMRRTGPKSHLGNYDDIILPHAEQLPVDMLQGHVK